MRLWKPTPKTAMLCSIRSPKSTQWRILTLLRSSRNMKVLTESPSQAFLSSYRKRGSGSNTRRGASPVNAEIGPNKDSIVAHARIYKHYADPDGSYLAEASASRSYSEKAPNASPREWAQTAAIGIALRHAGFGLQFKVAGEPALPITNELPAAGTSAGAGQPIRSETNLEMEAPALPEPIDPLEAAKQTLCPLKKYDGRTLGELVMLDPGFLKWMATKYQNDEHPEVPAAAKLLCEHALKTA